MKKKTVMYTETAYVLGVVFSRSARLYGACKFRSFNGRRTGLYIIFEDFGISAVLHIRYG